MVVEPSASGQASFKAVFKRPRGVFQSLNSIKVFSGSNVMSYASGGHSRQITYPGYP
ncbi:hypothetical protein N9M16_05815 [Candidatus Dependentiae bacterium]|nr:hypothetical protein [Candidatus Dependentiae bacterium]